MRAAAAPAAERRHDAQDLSEAVFRPRRQPRHGDGGQCRQHRSDRLIAEAGRARGAGRQRPAAVLGSQDMPENGVAIRSNRLIAEDVAALQVLGVVAAAQRLDEVGKAATRERVLLQMPGKPRCDSPHGGCGLFRRDVESRGQLGDRLPPPGYAAGHRASAWTCPLPCRGRSLARGNGDRTLLQRRIRRAAAPRLRRDSTSLAA